MKQIVSYSFTINNLGKNTFFHIVTLSQIIYSFVLQLFYKIKLIEMVTATIKLLPRKSAKKKDGTFVRDPNLIAFRYSDNVHTPKVGVLGF